jgi:hypothetical protein
MLPGEVHPLNGEAALGARVGSAGHVEDGEGGVLFPWTLFPRSPISKILILFFFPILIPIFFL